MPIKLSRTCPYQRKAGQVESEV